jgi:hypothetical protein
MRVGWLADPETDVVGGAELCVRRLLETRPDDLEVVPCPPGGIRNDVDCYAIHNCTRYTLREFLADGRSEAPIVKVVYEQWWKGDPALRFFLLAASRVALFLSPAHLDTFPHTIEVPTIVTPTFVDLEPFGRARHEHLGPREGVMWIAQMTSAHKGVDDAVRWAKDHRTVVDFYGGGWMRPPRHRFVRDHGQIDPAAVPATMAAHRGFLFLPTLLDTCSRTILEAWAAGLELHVNEHCGAMWWIENSPESIPTSHETFWNAVSAAAGSGSAHEVQSRVGSDPRRRGRRGSAGLPC